MSITDTNPTDRLPDAAAPYALARGEGEHLHFLNHLATLKVTAGPNSSMTAIEFHAPRGFGPPLHVHDTEDEIMILLDGEIRFSSGDVETVATSGATVFLPHGVPHTFQVLSETARFSTITACASTTPVFDQMVATLGTTTDEASIPDPREIDPAEVAEACAANGIQVLGPPPAPLA